MAKAKEIRQQRELEDELNQLQQTNQPSDDDVPDEGSRRKKKARTVVDSDAEEGSDAPKAKVRTKYPHIQSQGAKPKFITS